MSKKDPFNDLGGEVREDAERGDVGFFWKPTLPCYLIGKMDRIEPGTKYGDFAVLTNAIEFRAEDHKPERMAKERAVALGSANMQGKITAEDAGKWIRIDFHKWVPTANGRMRIMHVTVGLDAVKLKPILDKAAQRLAADLALNPDAGDGEERPF